MQRLKILLVNGSVWLPPTNRNFYQKHPEDIEMMQNVSAMRLTSEGATFPTSQRDRLSLRTELPEAARSSRIGEFRRETLVMIITDGDAFRAFRLVRRRRDAEPEVAELELPTTAGGVGPTDLKRDVPLSDRAAGRSRPDRLLLDLDFRCVQQKPFRRVSATVLRRLTAQIERVVLQEKADFWNLVAPHHLVFQLAPCLDPAVSARLRRVSFADVMALRGQSVA